MQEGNGLTAERMIAALEKANGYVSSACHELGCSRQHWYNKLKTYPTVIAAAEAIREKRTDYVESKMMKLIEAENPTMIIFYLKTQAKDRGYVERWEHTGAEGDNIKVTVKHDAS